MQDMIHSYWGHPHLCVIEIWKFPNVDTVYVAWDNFTDSPWENHLKFAICQEGNKKMGQTEIFIFFYNNMFVSFEKFQLSVWNFSKELIVCFTIAHLSVTKVARRSYHIWEECTMDFVNIITSETVFALDGQGAHNERMIKYSDFLLWHTEDIYLRIYWTTWASTELPQNLLNYLRIYWTTSESTELPENLLNYLRIYWTTWEITELPENFTELPGKLLNYLRILLNYLGNYWTTWEFYWTTSDFYWTTWVFASSNYSATWPCGSVLK